MDTKKGISQETLKLIACITMLIDHVGAALFPRVILLRMIGRIAFPIYCFLLAEGVAYTRNPKKYGMRLAIGMLLAELPFDLALFDTPMWQHQSVMVTLLLGFFALECVKKTQKRTMKFFYIFAFAILAEALFTDYGGMGVILIGFFGLIRGKRWEKGIMTLGLAVICYLIGSPAIPIFGLRIPIEMFGVLAMLPIALYSGKKVTHSAAIQWAFYLFYPVHLTLLAILLRI